MQHLNVILEQAVLNLEPPVHTGTQIKDPQALINLVNAAAEIRARLTLLEEALIEISKMYACEIDAASEFAKAVLERSLTYKEWLEELEKSRQQSQKKPST